MIIEPDDLPNIFGVCARVGSELVVVWDNDYAVGW